MSPREHDVSKLQNEGLQLRNQQFYLGTLALAGSGLTALIAPATSVLTTGKVPEIALVGAAASWLILLIALHCWSLRLRKLIKVIGLYLERHGYSEWEQDFRVAATENSRLLPSQSQFVAIMFTIYGVLVVISAELTFLSSPQAVTLRWEGQVGLVAAMIVYLLSIWTPYRLISPWDRRVESLWRLKTPSDGATQLAEADEISAGDQNCGERELAETIEK